MSIKKKIAIGAAATAGVLATTGTAMIIRDRLFYRAMDRDLSDSLAKIHDYFNHR